MPRKQPCDAIKSLWHFPVTGRGSFPIDMLRYDSCWPASEAQDSSAIDASFRPRERSERTIALVGLREPTEGRTSNNEPMNRAVEGVARQYLHGKQITEGLLNHVEVAIRAYDPCLSCATHALGQMPLQIELFDAGGRLLDRKSKGMAG